MAIENLQVDQFRNLSMVSVNPGSGVNFVIGPNGSGKTSLLEAIYCLATGKSFRTVQINRLINRDSEHFSVLARVKNGYQQHKLGFQRNHNQNILRLDGNNAKSPAELAQTLPVALIEAGLHQLIDGPPEFRRKFLDWGVFHVEPQFNTVWNRYQRLLKQRNASLKAGWSAKGIQHWDSDFVPTAMRLSQYRIAYLDHFKQIIADIIPWFRVLAEIEFCYQQGWNQELDFEEALRANFSSDKERGFTQIGPHRADLRIESNSALVRDTLSRGQQKILAASLILAQSRLLRTNRKSVIILVDDLPAELDKDHRQNFILALVETGAQIFITGTDQSLVDEANDADFGFRVFHVKQGKVIAA